jgi:hypothetical protein
MNFRWKGYLCLADRDHEGVILLIRNYRGLLREGSVMIYLAGVPKFPFPIIWDVMRSGS